MNNKTADYLASWWISFLIVATIFAWLGRTQEVFAMSGENGKIKSYYVTDAERNCMVQTAIGEATPNNKKEIIAIMRGMLKRRESGRWGDDMCSVVLSKKQYSVWNNKKLPKKPKRPNAQYKRYAALVDKALVAGPSRFDHYWHGKAMRKLYGRSRPYWARACVETVMVGQATLCRMKNS